jgi:glutathione S-transferase
MSQLRPFVLYGWRVSYFTGKLSSYLQCKGIPYTEKFPNLIETFHLLKKKTGASVMPVLLTPDGQWLQDTRDIINVLERDFPNPPVFPQTPRRQLASELLEAWGDEWWVPIAMHYRWNRPESVDFFRKEAGDNFLPHMPRLIKDIASSKAETFLRNVLPHVGARPEQFEMMERWTNKTLALLDAHFAVHPFLLGSSPSIGDFGLVGPMYAHLCRDPWPRDNLMIKYPNVTNWVKRIRQPHSVQPTDGVDISSDAIPETILPVLSAVLKEFTPMIEGTLNLLNKHLEAQPAARNKLLRRTIPGGDVSMPMDGSEFKRSANPFLLWKIQHFMDAYNNLPPAEKDYVKLWISDLGGSSLLQLKIPRLARENVHVRLL